MDVVSFNEVSRVRPSVNRDSERIYGCGARSAIRAKYIRPRSSLKTGPARPGHVNIPPVITAVNFGQFSVYNTGTSFLPRDVMHKCGLQCLSVCLSVSVTFMSCVKTNKDIFKIFSPSGSQAIIEFYALVNLKPQ